MKKAAQKYQQWHTLQRLKAVGCPVDHAAFHAPVFPLHISKVRTGLGTELIPTLQGTGILVQLRIQAFAPFTVSGWAVQLDWASQLVAPSECSQHPGFCCLEQSPHGNHIQFGASKVLNRRLLASAQFAKGSSMEKFLLLITPTVVSAAAGSKLRMTIIFYDLFSDRYPFSMELDNNQEVLNRTTAPGKTG